MPLVPDLADLALRIVLTLIASAAMGIERGIHGKAAGLRTTMLVGLAACLAMMQVNLLLPVDGKSPSSFATLDLMRLPLGILTGVGFIGAGVILRRGPTVIGVTTAATMWFVTVIGLLFGGGQIWLGIAGAIIGLVITQPLRWFEARLLRDRQATLTVRSNRTEIDGAEILRAVVQPPFKLVRMNYALTAETQLEDRNFHLRWSKRAHDDEVPAMVHQLGERSGILSVRWESGGIADD